MNPGEHVPHLLILFYGAVWGMAFGAWLVNELHDRRERRRQERLERLARGEDINAPPFRNPTCPSSPPLTSRLSGKGHSESVGVGRAPTPAEDVQ